jgi:thymidylate synthase (FAD)
MDILEGKTLLKPCLDKGFVRLVDVMPRLLEEGETCDTAITQAARVSYLTNTNFKPSDNETLIRYLMRHNHCYDRDTEVLTSKGWVSWPLVTEDHELACYDEQEDTLVYEKPKYLIQEYFVGDLYHIEHTAVDLAITPEHFVYVKTKTQDTSGNDVWESSFSLKKIKDLEITDQFAMRGFCVNRRKPAEDIFFEFPQDKRSSYVYVLGFICGAFPVLLPRGPLLFASFSGSDHIEFQKFLKNTDSISCYWKEDKKELQFCVYLDEEIETVLKTYFYTQDGVLFYRPEVQFLDKDDSLNFLLGFIGGRTCYQKRENISYAYALVCQDSREVDFIQILAMNAGMTTHYTYHGEVHTLHILSRFLPDPIINYRKQDITKKPYAGFVYCAHTRTGILVVRRNNKVVLCGNSTPFEMVEFKFHIKTPLFVARQWLRHRTASVNELSGRYSVMVDEFYIPESLRKQSTVNKQGSAGVVSDSEYFEFVTKLEENTKKMYFDYLEAVNKGVAKEQARVGLPVNIYTQFYWKIDLHNLFHFLALRMDLHAQEEIRVYADAIYDLISPLVPLSVQAWNEYHILRNALKLTSREVDALFSIFNNITLDNVPVISNNKREQDEFVMKLKKLGFMFRNV